MARDPYDSGSLTEQGASLVVVTARIGLGDVCQLCTKVTDKIPCRLSGAILRAKVGREFCQ